MSSVSVQIKPMTPFFFSRCKGVAFTNGIDTTNNNPAKGTPLNPHNTHYYTGGSSGGTAYVVAAGLCPVACKAHSTLFVSLKLPNQLLLLRISTTNGNADSGIC